MQGVAKEKKRTRPFFGWTSFGLSVAGLLAAVGIIATSPHDNFVAAIAGLLLCGFVSVLGVLAGVIGLNRSEQPKHPGLASIAVGAAPAGLLLLFLLFGMRGCQFENGF
jgi:hypothetical protein